MSKTQKGMALIIAAFLEHAAGDEDCTTLSKPELIGLLKEEFKHSLGNATDPAQVEELFRMLDGDQSGFVDFKEYMQLVTTLTVMCGDLVTKKH